MSYFDDHEDSIVYGGQPREPRISRRAVPGSPLARAQIAAHAAFDPLWKSGLFHRSVAYEWLASELGMSKRQCHISLFNVEQCRRVVAICEAHPECQRAKAKLLADDFEDLD